MLQWYCREKLSLILARDVIIEKLMHATINRHPLITIRNINFDVCARRFKTSNQSVVTATPSITVL